MGIYFVTILITGILAGLYTFA